MVLLKFATRRMDIKYRDANLAWVTTPRKERLSWLLMLTIGEDDDHRLGIYKPLVYRWKT